MEPKNGKVYLWRKNGTHILDLRKSLPLIEKALKFAYESAKNKKKFLFVSTKKQHSEIVENIAKETTPRRVNTKLLNRVLQLEENLGYYVENGKYWKQLANFDQEKIDVLDKLWDEVIELD